MNSACSSLSNIDLFREARANMTAESSDVHSLLILSTARTNSFI